jgi:hypothetical protein
VIHVLTAFAPTRLDVQRTCVASWKALGLEVHAFAHPSNAELARSFNVDVILTEDAAHATFGPNFIPVNCMTEWAKRETLDVLLLNSDIELQITAERLEDLHQRATDGDSVCCFRRHNEAGESYYWGLDGFLINPRSAELLAPSILALGLPWWDYWVPSAFLAAKLPVYVVEKCAFHRDHYPIWADNKLPTHEECRNNSNYLICGLELARLLGVQPPSDLIAFARSTIADIHRRSQVL